MVSVSTSTRYPLVAEWDDQPVQSVHKSTERILTPVGVRSVRMSSECT